MAAVIHRCPMFPWDSAAGDGIHLGVLPDDGFDSGTRFRLGLDSAEGIYARARAWQLIAHLSISSPTGGLSMHGELSVVARAISHFTDGGIPLGNEGDVPKHGGWSGRNAALGMWTDGDGNLFDPGPASLTLGDVTGVVTSAVTFGPILRFEPHGVAIFIGETGTSVGGRVDGALPITHDNGSFDGYTGEVRTFLLKIGAAGAGSGEPYDVVATGGTLNPVTWWPYDTEDGNGPVYNANTGAWIQDASLFR